MPSRQLYGARPNIEMLNTELLMSNVVPVFRDIQHSEFSIQHFQRRNH